MCVRVRFNFLLKPDYFQSNVSESNVAAQIILLSGVYSIVARLRKKKKKMKKKERKTFDSRQGKFCHVTLAGWLLSALKLVEILKCDSRADA